MSQTAAVKVDFHSQPKHNGERIIFVDLPQFFKSFRMTHEGHRLLDDRQYVTEKLEQFERVHAKDMAKGEIAVGPFQAYHGFNGLGVSGNMYELFGVVQAVRDGRIPREAVRRFPLHVPRDEVRQFARFTHR